MERIDPVTLEAIARALLWIIRGLARLVGPLVGPIEGGLLLKERAPGVDLATIEAATATRLIICGDVPEMPVR